MSCSGLTRPSKDTRHGLTICTQKATRFNKGSCRSRCCGQAGYSLRASTKVRAAAGNAVKLATACALQQRFAPQPVSAQGRPLVKLATACQQTRATVRVSTDLTPAFFMAKAHSLRVDPVVITSSINTMRLFLRRSGCRTLKAFLTLEIRA